MIKVHTPGRYQGSISRGDILITPATGHGQTAWALWRAQGRGWSNATEHFTTYIGYAPEVPRILGLPGAAFARAMRLMHNREYSSAVTRAAELLPHPFKQARAVRLILRAVHCVNVWNSMDIAEDTPPEMLDALLGAPLSHALSRIYDNDIQLFQHIIAQGTRPAHMDKLYLKAYTNEELAFLDIQGEP